MNCRMYLQMLIYLDVWLFIMWSLSTIFHLAYKFSDLGYFTRFLSLSMLLAMIVIECMRMYLSFLGNLSHRVPELAGFWIISVLLQLPLISYFVFNPYLKNKPAEWTLHVVKWIFLLSEIIVGYFTLKSSASIAKQQYLSKSQMTIDTVISHDK